MRDVRVIKGEREVRWEGGNKKGKGKKKKKLRRGKKK